VHKRDKEEEMSKIEWTHRPGTKSEVLNPTTGCDKVSAGCRECYAEVMHKRLRGMGQPKYQQPFLGGATFWPDELAKPFKWKKPRTVFLNSMSDIFHVDITVPQIAQIYAMMFLTQWHTYIVLTKRADRAYYVLNSVEFFEEFHKACNMLHDKYIQTLEQEMYQMIEIESMWPLRNVWQGVSVENQDTLNDRGNWLTKTPAHIRVISYEPALGPIDLLNLKGDAGSYFQILEPITGCGDSDRGRIDWVIAGGESGHAARPAHPDWFRQVRDQCAATGVSFFFKQWGKYGEHARAVSLCPPDKGLGYFNSKYVYRDGRVSDFESTDYRDIDNGECEWVFDLGKHESGNYLDGVQHLEFPA
jgi:protein gp37